MIDAPVGWITTRDVAQFGSARRLGRRGRRFESGHPDQNLGPEFPVTPELYVALVRPEPVEELLEAIARWDRLSRWERSEVGRSLRRLGWTYGEIMEVIPVGKGTLSYWCSPIRLSAEQIEAIRERRPAGVRTGIPIDTQRKRRQEVDYIRGNARLEVTELLGDPLWLIGTVLYWAEGDKSTRRLALVNTDPVVLRAFVAWVRRFHNEQAEFVGALHLHEGNDDEDARRHWTSTLGLCGLRFDKTYVKPAGTGHRKNHLQHGICRLRVSKSGNGFHKTMGWIDGLAAALDSSL